MINDVDALFQIGNVFPPSTEANRLLKYSQQKALYNGHHDYIFHRWNKIEGVKDLNVMIGWHKRLTMLWADMLLSQAPEIKAENQERLDELLHSNDFINTMYEVAIDYSRHGTGIMKVYKEAESIIESTPPDIWFPVVSPQSIKRVTHHILAWKYKKVTGEGVEKKERHYLQVEIHSKNDITYRLYETKSDSTIFRLAEAETIETHNLGEFLVKPLNNVTTSSDITGDSDYDDINNIVEELEIRFTQASNILNKHADPKMYGSEDALEIDEFTGETVVKGGGKFFPVAEGEEAPAYLTWDGKLTDSFKMIDQLMEQFYCISNTSPASFGQMKQGLAESGSALKRLMASTIIKSNRMRVKFEKTMLNVLNLANRLDMAAGKPSTGKISIEWREALPEDQTEMTQNEVARMGVGLTSPEASIARLDHLTGEVLESEVAKANESYTQRHNTQQSNPDEA